MIWFRCTAVSRPFDGGTDAIATLKLTKKGGLGRCIVEVVKVAETNANEAEPQVGAKAEAFRQLQGDTDSKVIAAMTQSWVENKNRATHLNDDLEWLTR